jgi:hypothetical protein
LDSFFKVKFKVNFYKMICKEKSFYTLGNMEKLSNGWKIPSSTDEIKALLADFERNITEMEKENPLTIFRENMENGILFKAALQDAMNQLNTFSNLYMSAAELREILVRK